VLVGKLYKQTLPTYKPRTYQVIAYFPTELVTKVKPNTNSVEVHPQLSNKEHPVDGFAGGCWFIVAEIGIMSLPPSPTPNNLRGKQSKVTKEDKYPM
jgi:hypothetical protein